MADFNPQERVKKMVQAIKNEAKEKAEQIMDSAAQQFKIEKNKMINQQKEKIIDEFKRQMESYTIQKRIQRSSKINQSRLSKMQVRYELIQKLKGEIKESIHNCIQDQATYKQFLMKLIVQVEFYIKNKKMYFNQGLIKLMETKVEVQCLEEDLKLVQSVIGEAEKQFSQVLKEQTGADIQTKVTINTDHFLGVEGKKILGGVVLSCHDGRIVCANTIDERLDLSFQEFLPEIRSGLFPEKKK